MVKKSLICIFIFSLVLLHSAESKIIVNPETPLAKNAGRLVKITEMFRIIDNGEDYFFRHPRRLAVGPDGTIYLTDKKQLLKFDKQGKFISNLHKFGEGPGEYINISSFHVTKDRILINARNPIKIMSNDLSGNLIKEKRLTKCTSYIFGLGFFDNKFYYLDAWMDYSKIKSSVQAYDMKLYVRTFDDQITDLKLNMPMHVIFDLETGDAYSQERFIFTLENEHSLYASHTSQYMVKHIDLSTGKIICQFNRKYKRIPFVAPQSSNEPPSPEKFNPKFFSDITKIALYKDNIWAFTSTVDQEKGILVDIFSKEGKYLDNFYLQLPNIERPDTLDSVSFTIDEDFLYIVEPDEDENPTIVKYKIEL